MEVVSSLPLPCIEVVSIIAVTLNGGINHGREKPHTLTQLGLPIMPVVTGVIETKPRRRHGQTLGRSPRRDLCNMVSGLNIGSWLRHGFRPTAVKHARCCMRTGIKTVHVEEGGSGHA